MGSTWDFQQRFALAAIRTADNPGAPIHELTGSFQKLKAALKQLGGTTGTLSRMVKPDDLDSLVLSGDEWKFTANGIRKYREHLDWARRQSGPRLDPVL